jgi:general secretion pathway protein J
MTRQRPRERGFTLLELIVALTLLALMASVLFGALGFAGRSWEGGETKAEATAQMRLSHGFLRTQLESQHPMRMRKMPDFPLLFTGTNAELRFAAPLPARVTGGGVWLYRVRVAEDDDRGRLVLERMLPDTDAGAFPEFDDADRSVLAEGVKELRIDYYGYDAGVSRNAATPSWRDRWEDRQRLPILIRIEVVPRAGASWPPLVVSPRKGLQAGCRQWDIANERCVGMS